MLIQIKIKIIKNVRAKLCRHANHLWRQKGQTKPKSLYMQRFTVSVQVKIMIPDPGLCKQLCFDAHNSNRLKSTKKRMFISTNAEDH